MAEAAKTVITTAGLKKIEDELNDLKVNRRREVAEKLKDARAQGDLSENAEYDAAKDEQREIEARISLLEERLKNIEVVDEGEVTLDKVSVGCRVKVHDIVDNEDLAYTIVGSSEANSLQGKISNESPVGKALIGAKIGDTVREENGRQSEQPESERVFTGCGTAEKGQNGETGRASGRWKRSVQDYNLRPDLPYAGDQRQV